MSSSESIGKGQLVPSHKNKVAKETADNYRKQIEDINCQLDI